MKKNRPALQVSALVRPADAESLAAIYPQEAAIETAKALAGTDFSLQSLACDLIAVGKLRAIPVTQREEKFFQNINEFADLESH